MEKLPEQKESQKIEETKETTENLNIEEIEEIMDPLLQKTESDATLTSTEKSLLPEQECKLPSYIHKCYKGHEEAVICITVHPVHKDILVSGGMDDRLLFWSLSEERILGEMNLEETINQVGFSSDGKYLGICVMGGKFVVFEIKEDEKSDTKCDKNDEECLILKTEKLQVRDILTKLT
jgi:WD40 repeat protein